MSGMIPGVGVPHRRRINHDNHRWLHTALDDPNLLRERSNPSIDLNETALKARQRLEKKLGYCLQLPSRSSNQNPIGAKERNPKTQRKDNTGLGSIRRPWNFPLLNRVNESVRKIDRSQSDRNFPCC